MVLEFDPPIKDPEVYKEVMRILHQMHPKLTWASGRDIIGEVPNFMFRGTPEKDITPVVHLHLENFFTDLTWDSDVYNAKGIYKNSFADGWEYLGIGNIEDVFNQLYEQEEDPLEWAQEIVKNTPNFELGQKVIVTNQGSHYPTNTEVMLELGIPGVEEFLNKYGQHWWTFAPEYDGDDYSVRWDINEKFLLDEVPVLGDPRNGDICYVIGEPFTEGDLRRDIYRLYRESDGKQFIMGGYGFEPVDDSKIMKEGEDELEWAKEVVNEPIKMRNLFNELGDGDELTLSGEILSGDGEVLCVLDNNIFTVKRMRGNTKYLEWKETTINRPRYWESITGEKEFNTIEINLSNYPSDGDLIINDYRKADYPF